MGRGIEDHADPDSDASPRAPGERGLTQDMASLEHQQIRPPRAAESAEARHVSVLVFLVALVLFIVAIPFLQDLPHGDLIQSALLTLVLVSGLLAIGVRRGMLAPAAVLVIAALVTYLVFGRLWNAGLSDDRV